MSSRKSVIAIIVLPVVLLLSLLSVGVASARPSHQPATQPAVATITIHSFSYSVPASVLHGAAVNVVNQDSVAHTVTSNATGKFSVRVPAHSTRTFHAPATAQKYGFHCIYHSDMHGILKVR